MVLSVSSNQFVILGFSEIADIKEQEGNGQELEWQGYCRHSRVLCQGGQATAWKKRFAIFFFRFFFNLMLCICSFNGLSWLRLLTF